MGDPGHFEQCDDGNTTSGDGCSATCEVEAGWRCDMPNQPCRQPKCGDGLIDWFAGAGGAGGAGGAASAGAPASAGFPGTGGAGNGGWAEQCDDGNATSGDGCDATCSLEAGYSCQMPGQPCKLAVGGRHLRLPERRVRRRQSGERRRLLRHLLRRMGGGTAGAFATGGSFAVPAASGGARAARHDLAVEQPPLNRLGDVRLRARARLAFEIGDGARDAQHFAVRARRQPSWRIAASIKRRLSRVERGATRSRSRRGGGRVERALQALLAARSRCTARARVTRSRTCSRALRRARRQ